MRGKLDPISEKCKLEILFVKFTNGLAAQRLVSGPHVPNKRAVSIAVFTF